MPLVFDTWISSLQLAPVRLCLANLAVKIPNFSQVFIADFYHSIIPIIEGKCFVPAEINTLSLNLSSMSTMLWPTCHSWIQKLPYLYHQTFLEFPSWSNSYHKSLISYLLAFLCTKWYFTQQLPPSFLLAEFLLQTSGCNMFRTQATLCQALKDEP